MFLKNQFQHMGHDFSSHRPPPKGWIDDQVADKSARWRGLCPSNRLQTVRGFGLARIVAAQRGARARRMNGGASGLDVLHARAGAPADAATLSSGPLRATGPLYLWGRSKEDRGLPGGRSELAILIEQFLTVPVGLVRGHG